MSRPSLFFVIATTLIISLSPVRSAQALEITTSIKPLQLLVASITAGISQPRLLIPGASSPHDYQMRPSERRQLEQAELVFWIGPALEMSLTKVLQQLPASARVITLAEESDNPDPQTQDEHADDEHGHHAHGIDPHIWLDPDLGAELAARIAAVLSEADPAHKADYQHNLERFLTRLIEHDQQLKALLEPVKNLGYFVFHDAYQRFEQHYQLNHLGAFTLNPERNPGARHLTEIKQQLVERQAVCVFTEPQFAPALVTNLITGTPVRLGELDPLGIDIQADADGYFKLLTRLGESFEHCLSAP
ncbi:MAG: zinc transport system substrate-binding protein [Motiliproteus sp.]|jgi:zinc transport system substrate-binding protein